MSPGERNRFVCTFDSHQFPVGPVKDIHGLAYLPIRMREGVIDSRESDVSYPEGILIKPNSGNLSSDTHILHGISQAQIMAK
jgi:hypothetical protein